MSSTISSRSLMLVATLVCAGMAISSAMRPPRDADPEAALANYVTLASVLHAPPERGRSLKWDLTTDVFESAGLTGPGPADDDEVYEVPRVAMSAQHEATCLVKVGDPFPEFSLPNELGMPQALAGVMGRTVTVVLLWSEAHPMAREQFQRIGSEVAIPFEEQGVQVVAVHVESLPEGLVELRGQTDARVACLADPDRSFFSKIATTKLPRTYLLDRDQKILWMDIEYSRDTRRELDNAIRYYLSKG